MEKIKLLNDDIIIKIAAGEVIERPVSVVKELVENSIDAKAAQIIVTVEKGGCKLIKVADNGSGMSSKDAELCVERHTTSKISNIDDLFEICTLGFRGEALASIAAISKFELLTKEKKSKIGTKVTVDGGKSKNTAEAGCPDGTIITVKDLFFNTPARLKFLKSPAAELGHISDFLFKESLAYPDISFQLINNGQVIFNAESVKTSHERVLLLYGSEAKKEFLKVNFKGKLLTIEGVVSKPSYTRLQRTHQHIFLNGRLISDKAITRAIAEGYGSLLPTGRYPVVVLYINIPSSMVDVNVHPTKKEVKFSRGQDVFEDVVNSIRRVFSLDVITYPSVSKFKDKRHDAAPFVKGESYKQEQWISGDTAEKSSMRTEELFEEYFAGPGKLIGQIDKTFIVSECDEGMMLVDQHAAHERVLYERLVNKKGDICKSQGLLIPSTFALNAPDLHILLENLQELEKLGFEISHLGKDMFSVHAVPSVVSGKDQQKVIQDIIDNIKESKKAKLDVKDRIYKVLACRGSVMANDVLDKTQMEKLIADLRACKISYCPHGRPAMVILTIEEIRKFFHRNS